MYEPWTSHDWAGTSESNAGGVALAEPMDETAVDAAEEEMPKPFLNEYLPTPEEIRRACLEIQRGWTESERRRRRGYRRAHCQPHVLRTVRTVFAG